MKILNRITISTVIVATGCLFSAASAVAEEVELKSLPEAVQTTINEQAAGGNIREIERETDDGMTYYEVDLTKDGKRMEFKVSDTGALLSKPMTTAERVAERLRNAASSLTSNEVTFEQLPTEVQATVKQETAGGKITEIEQEEKGGITFYEVEFEKDGKDHEILIDLTGKVVKRDD